MFDTRDGEIALQFDPAERAADAGLIFIGHVRSPWTERKDCPKNMRAARERGEPAELLLDAAWRQGLLGLSAGDSVVILTWLHHSPRNLIVQRPRNSETPRGVFALRSPVRPNPVGLHVVKLISLDAESGILGLEAIDVLDGTPVIDIKPWFASTDLPQGADQHR